MKAKGNKTMEKILLKQKLMEKLLEPSGKIEKKLIPEVIPISTPIVEVMKVTGIYWPEAHKNAELMFKLASATNEICNLNSVNVPFDMTIEAEALGCKVVWDDSITSTPQVKDGNIKAVIPEISHKLFQKGRFPIVFEAIKLLKEKYRQFIPVITFVQGPFTVASHFFGVDEMFKMILKNPFKIRGILKKFTELSILYANKQLSSGSDFILLLDPNVSGLNGNQFKDFIIPTYKNILNEVNGEIILHICGNIKKIIAIIPESGFKALSFDFPAINIDLVKETVGNKIKLVGGVPTIDCLLNGGSNDVFNQVIDCISKGIDIVAPSCCIPPEVKISNLKEILKAIKHYNQNRTEIKK